MNLEIESDESDGLPLARLCVGVTGHRDGNSAFQANRAGIERSLAAIFEVIDSAAAMLPGGAGRTRLHSLLAPGADMTAMEAALSRGWEVVAPLPFGLDISIAVNCRDVTEADARALIDGEVPPSPGVAAQAEAMRNLAARVQLFQLAEQDSLVARRFLATTAAPDDRDSATAYAIIASERAAVAARVMIEQSDLLIAVWDGASLGSIGGTRHSIENALYHGAPVIWIDAADPASIHFLEGPDALESWAPAGHRGDRGVVAALARPASRHPDARNISASDGPRAAGGAPCLSPNRDRLRRAGQPLLRSIVEHYETPMRSPRARVRDSGRRPRLPGRIPASSTASGRRCFSARPSRCAVDLFVGRLSRRNGGELPAFRLRSHRRSGLSAVGDGQLEMAVRRRGAGLAAGHRLHHLRRPQKALAWAVARDPPDRRISSPHPDPAAARSRQAGRPLAPGLDHAMARILCAPGIARGGPARGRRDPGLSSRRAGRAGRALRPIAARLSSPEGGEARDRAPQPRPALRDILHPRDHLGQRLSAADRAGALDSSDETASCLRNH